MLQEYYGNSRNFRQVKALHPEPPAWLCNAPRENMKEHGIAASVAQFGQGSGMSRRVGLIAGLLLVLAGLFAIGFWPRWHAMRVAQAEAGAESAPVVVYVVAERGKSKADLSLPANLRAFQETIIY